MNSKLEKLKEQFDKECEIVDLSKFYPCWVGTAKIGIHTEISDEELQRKYADILIYYEPYLIINDAVFNVICIKNKSIKEHERKEKRRHLAGLEFDELAVEKDNENFILPSAEDQFERKEDYKKVIQFILTFKPKQRIRCYKYFVLGLTQEEIAKTEKVKRQTVGESIENGRYKLVKFLKNKKLF